MRPAVSSTLILATLLLASLFGSYFFTAAANSGAPDIVCSVLLNSTPRRGRDGASRLEDRSRCRHGRWVTPSPIPAPTATPIPTPTPQEPVDTPYVVVTPDPDGVMPVSKEPGAEDYLDGGLGSKDIDCDGVRNSQDNCVFIYNPEQKDKNKDGVGDACSTRTSGFTERDQLCDMDLDGVENRIDNCPAACNPDQKDKNKDGIGDACDSRKTKLAAVKTCKSSKSTDSKKAAKKSKDGKN